MRIAERCNVTIAEGRELPAELRRAGRLHARRLLRARRARGLRGAAAAAAAAARRPARCGTRSTSTSAASTYEIDDDQADGVPGYFLIVWDFIRYAREQGIPVGPGRGSAAGSLVAYCLRITDVDPLDFDLIFERFLNPERVSLPDIDIDFCERRRGEVIEYVTRKYGRENVAQIITFGTMKAKAVVRDVGRVLEMPFADVDKVAKLIPPALDMTLDKALEENPALREMEQNDPKVKELLDVGAAPRGHDAPRVGPRRRRRHRAEGRSPSTRRSTRARATKSSTQWAMKEIERVGLLKMDFLGLSTLTLIDDAIAEIKRTDGRSTLDIDNVPLDDAKTYQLFQDGADLRHLPVRELAACATSCARPSRSGSTT